MTQSSRFPGPLGWWLPLFIAVSTVGCTGVLAGSDTASEGVQELKNRVLELQRQVTVHQVEIERLRRRVAEMEGEPVPPPLPVPPSQRRSADEGALPPPPPPSTIEESDLEAVRYGQPAAPPSGTEVEPPPAPLPAPINDPGGLVSEVAQVLYDEGYTLYHQGRYLDAETKFQLFLQKHGETNLADNAQFWIGAGRFARGDRQGALAAFLETVERYPEGNKVPDALFKAGQCLEALGDQERARYTYQEVAQRFPGTTAALNAEEALQRRR